MMMTAAGTIAAGAGSRDGRGRCRPAGDRHRAPAWRHRVGAPTCAPPPRNRSNRLGATFVAVDSEEIKQAETAGGYAKEMCEEYQAHARRR